MKKKITILGEEVTVTFCMATELAYETISGGKPFDISKMNSVRDTYVMNVAAISSCKDNNLTEDFYERLLNEATADEYMTLTTAVIECMKDFLHITPVGEEKELQDKQPAEGEGEGN